MNDVLTQESTTETPETPTPAPEGTVAQPPDEAQATPAAPVSETTPSTPTPAQETPPSEPKTTESESEAPVSEPSVLEAKDYKLPEGMPTQVADFAAEQKLSQEQLDVTLKTFGEFILSDKAAEQQTLRQMGESHIETWGEEKDQKLSLARRALAHNDPDKALAKALNDSGYGNHPAVLDFLYKVGTMMTEGGFIKSNPRSVGQKKSAAAVMFPNHPTKE